MSKNLAVDQQILEIVEKIRSSARDANDTYERKVRAIEHKAAYSSFDISQMNAAMELVADTKKAMDELYTSYEALVRTLDITCRPLAEQGASCKTVREVYKLIEYMNKESSSIEGGFTASFNSASLGDIAGIQYIASLEAQTIEKIWKSKYNMMPERESVEKEAAQQELKKEQDKKLAKENALSQKVKAVKQAKNEKQEKERLEIKRNKPIVDSCYQKINDFKFDLEEEIAKKQERLLLTIEQKKKSLAKQLTEHQNCLNSLGVFKFSQKKQEQKAVAELEEKLYRLKTKDHLTEQRDRWQRAANQAVDNYKKEVASFLEKRFNIWQKTIGVPDEALKLYAVLEPHQPYQSLEMKALVGSKLSSQDFLKHCVKPLREAKLLDLKIELGEAVFYLTTDEKLHQQATKWIQTPYTEDMAFSHLTCPEPPAVESIIQPEKILI